MIYVENFEIIKDIVESLKKQFKDKNENIQVDDFFQKNITENTKLCIVENSYKKLSKQEIIKTQMEGKIDTRKLDNYKYILLIDEHVDSDVFDYFLKYEIIGIFRKSRLEYEFEEKGKLEKLLKEEIRNLAYSKNEEQNTEYIKKYPYKKITSWKFNPKVQSKKDLENLYTNQKYVSIFLDPSMRDFYHKLKIIIDDFVSSYKTFENDVKDTFKYIQNDKSNTPDKLQDFITKELNKIFKLPSVLIEGETGTGKSLIANIIYNAVKNILKNGDIDFYKFSLVNIEKNLINSEIFGTRKGAYTGAEDRKGRLLENIFNIVFFDEIAEVPPSTQSKLLLYLDDYRITPEGYDKEPLTVPTFLIAATNKDIKKEIELGNFRKDLYHRFKYKIKIPSLKERKEDMRFLISFILQSPFINQVDENLNYSVDKISLEAIEKLENFTYTGNFRELESVLKNSVNDSIIKNQSIILPENIQF
jgi:transcriptional regulator with PAS, ATPase and Fis domain